MRTNTKKLILCALFAALACAATLSIRIPTPGTGGYIHPGDAIVILSGIFLGPVYGALAAGIGSALADLLGGYLLYVPITFLVKAIIGFLAGMTFQYIHRKGVSSYIGVVAGGVIDMLLVPAGYFLCEMPIYGVAGALASVPANFVQGIGGLVIAFILFPILSAVPDFRNMMAANNHISK